MPQDLKTQIYVRSQKVRPLVKLKSARGTLMTISGLILSTAGIVFFLMYTQPLE